MPQDRLLIRALRRDDFLDLTFEIINAHAEGTPARLVRAVAGTPVLLIVHFPPQHVAEQAFPQDDAGTLVAGPLPVHARLAGKSRLVFKLPDAENEWPLTLGTLLSWHLYSPVLAPNALPLGATSGPGIAPPAEDQTALEIPTGLYLSPDETSTWLHALEPVNKAGRLELWHTRLVPRTSPGEPPREDVDRYLRAIWSLDTGINFTTSLTAKQRADIAHLSSDFSLPSMPPNFLRHLFDYPQRVVHWRAFLTSKGMPLRYVPRPIHARRLMLSSAGAWANLETSWDYPTVIPGKNDNLGYPLLALEQWEHIAAQGRDHFVKTVEKAFLCDTGHRVSVVTITEREFTPTVVRREGPVPIFGANAFLRQYSYIQVQEPIKDYRPLASAYQHDGREMLFKRIHITTRSTPKLDPFPKDQPFWPKVGNNTFKFQIVAEDYEGKLVRFERPLMCVPLRAVVTTASWSDTTPWKSILNRYHEGGGGDPPTLGLRTIKLGAQSVAFAETGGRLQDLGKTTYKTDEVVFEAQLVDGEKIAHLPNEHPLFLPKVGKAKVAIPAVERLLGQPSLREIRFNDDYLNHGFAPASNKGELFAELISPLDIPFAAEKAGGLVKPDMSIKALSRALGPVSSPAAIQRGEFDTSMFDKAKFLGGITLKDILKPAAEFDLNNVKTADLPAGKQLQDLLAGPAFKITVPLLTSRTRYAPGGEPIAAETRFLWKPEVKPHNIGIFTFQPNDGTQLILQALMVTSFDGEPSTFETEGRLEDFALDFAGAMRLKFVALGFRSRNGKKMDVSADGLALEFKGPLKFVETLKNILPADGFKDPPYLDVTPSGIRAGYTLGVPSVGVGIFSLQNISLSAGLSLPFIDQPAGVRFAISERHKPFLVTVGIFGGGGFFALALTARGIEQIEAAIEFGGNVCLNLGVASGGVFIMAGIYFGMTGAETKLTGYLRCGGFLSVLGLISISVEFYLGFTYRTKEGGGGEAWGQASLTVRVEVICFSKSIILTVERKFAGAAGDPSFAELVEPEDWEAYCGAFA